MESSAVDVAFTRAWVIHSVSWSDDYRGRNVHILEVPNISLDTAAGPLKMRPITLITHEPPCSCSKNMINKLFFLSVHKTRVVSLQFCLQYLCFNANWWTNCGKIFNPGPKWYRNARICWTTDKKYKERSHDEVPPFSISENQMNQIYIFLISMLSMTQCTEILFYFFFVIENMKKTQPQK